MANENAVKTNQKIMILPLYIDKKYKYQIWYFIVNELF